MIGWIAATGRDVYSIKVVLRALNTCLVFVPALVACSAQVTSEADAEPTQLTALVEIDRTMLAANDPGHGVYDVAHGEAIARFVRTHVGDENAVGIVGNSELPSIGTCASTISTTSPKRSIELLDVGSITVDGAGTRTTLVARRLPDVVDLVSGVVYTARGPEEGSFGAGKYVLHVAGTSDVPTFAREADAPSAPVLLRVADQDPSQTVLVGDTTDITWEAGSDLVVIDNGALRCAFADTGHATIATPSAQGTIAVHRIHREAFVTQGIDRGEIRFDFSRVVPYRHR